MPRYRVQSADLDVWVKAGSHTKAVLKALRKCRVKTLAELIMAHLHRDDADNDVYFATVNMLKLAGRPVRDADPT